MAALDFTDIVKLTCDLIDLPSVSGDEALLADLVEAALRSRPNLEVLRFQNNVLARTNLGRAQRVVVAGHLDTVPPADNTQSQIIAAGQSCPDGSLAAEDLVWGLGGCDMKGGVAVALRAALTIDEPQFDVTYLFYECEEVDSARNGLTHVAAKHADWLQGEVAVLLEPAKSAIEAGCQGTLRARIRTSGRRSHSARSWMGHNAIHDLAPALQRLAEYEPRRVLVDGLEYREGLNAVGISGGIAGNVIPDAALLEVNFRYAPTLSMQQAEAHVREVFRGFDVEIVDNAGGALPGLDRAPLADLLQRVGGKVGPKFGWTDVARFSAMGVPAVNAGPGDPSLAHAPNEHVPISQLRSCENLICAWLRGEQK